MRELRIELEVGTCCGKCHTCAKEVLQSSLDELQAEPMLMAPGEALAA